MNWTEFLKKEMEEAYETTEKLMDFVEEGSLGWKPATGSNWMTVGQVLHHLGNACGLSMRGFITGDWGLPDGTDLAEMSPEEMMPPAEKLPAVGSVAEAKKMLSEDRKVAREALGSTSEGDLSSKKAPAPWNPTPMILGHRLHQMILHLVLHRAQLFYYLKLQGKPVHTGHLWGM
ncbi:MAG: DinB family protein [Candidatus Eisenbacteria bacterium]|nr:DinB family protein [Candidatus Eisenbacteria bacterium]